MVDHNKAVALYQIVLNNFVEQSEVWKKRNAFERQWMSRDFEKQNGMSMEEMLNTLKNLGDALKNQTSASAFVEPLKRLASYYGRLLNLLKGFEKDPKKLEDNTRMINGWIQDVENLISALTHEKIG
jgi:midasin (ATPase involved in ribosome maturation)